MGFERIVVAESGFLRVTESSGDAVAGYVGDSALGVGDDFSALNVETFDFGEGATDDCLMVVRGVFCKTLEG